MAERKTALLIGATGIIGGNLARRLDTLDDRDTVGPSQYWTVAASWSGSVERAVPTRQGSGRIRLP